MDPIFFAKIRIIIIITMKNGGKNIKHLHFLSLWSLLSRLEIIGPEKARI